jgi:hypothetical protein
MRLSAGLVTETFDYVGIVQKVKGLRGNTAIKVTIGFQKNNFPKPSRFLRPGRFFLPGQQDFDSRQA